MAGSHQESNAATAAAAATDAATAAAAAGACQQWPGDAEVLRPVPFARQDDDAGPKRGTLLRERASGQLWATRRAAVRLTLENPMWTVFCHRNIAPNVNQHTYILGKT